LSGILVKLVQRSQGGFALGEHSFNPLIARHGVELSFTAFAETAIITTADSIPGEH
jgi:hypothetical protein